MREVDEITREMFVKKQQAKEIAKNLINLGLDNEMIVKATSLALEEIIQLRNNAK